MGIRKAFQIDNHLSFTASDRDAKDGGVGCVSQEVDGAAIARPHGIAMEACVERRPVLGVYIEDIDGEKVEGGGRYRLTIRRPEGRELTIRARKSDYLTAGEVEDTYV